MSGYTKGRAIVGETTAGFYVGIEHSDHIICEEIGPYTGNGEADAALIAEAFNVAHETGRTPAQLAAERAELVGAIEPVLAQYGPPIEWDGWEDADGESMGDRLRGLSAILAKVKGPVQS